MADTDQERTEQPTGKRLQQARAKGQIARSKELGTASVLLAAVFGLLMVKESLAGAMVKILTMGFTLDRDQAFDPNAMGAMVPALLRELLHPLGLLFMLVAIAAFVGNTLMGGMNFSSEAMLPKWSKLSPLNGLKRMFGVQSLVELIKSIAKVVFITLFAWWMLSSQFNHLLNLSLEGYPGGIIDALDLLLWMLIILCCALIPIVAIDVPFQQWNHMRQLKMTKQEVKDEFKDSEGKPEVKGRIRRLQMEMAMRRMMGDVPKADVVITNPTHYSVALKYDTAKPGAAPKVVAKGTDEIAMKIREIAREYEIPIMPSPGLTRAIFHSTEIGHEIPEGLFAAVAQVLAYVYQLKKFRRGRGRRPNPLAKDLPIPPEFRK
ncbi:flagellar biosynthesis protein FlhB [Aeromonas sp. MR19]|uniref:Flagellar biosynthetic protein FlhB n=1 Tax=Aeromonas bestiarum TaxID=105751 RepID=A0ABT7PUW6_9GAMM|nr:MULTISPECIES: flagellar biosynthesis protein FlhB [Aeromonas]ATM01414.1 flagellar biosynthesis protein FlhB [Aeromonas sp. CA23]MCH7376994.1 flagellar biosynthesis protein FlhB [Aeromonas sp. MR19]MDM5070889.1 flagellar biosynthesis protein FlhB [Aeromonas bestiarum]MDM5087840.1 flagellar biosynthesis protein FlhB [Aeromonas bestiarum]HEH9403243.1 flagellar biosynthesis protein FlhB [Aeromonas bestiarum]